MEVDEVDVATEPVTLGADQVIKGVLVALKNVLDAHVHLVLDDLDGGLLLPQKGGGAPFDHAGLLQDVLGQTMAGAEVVSLHDRAGMDKEAINS